ncbi:MAG: ETC complex I subunit [Hyphomonadaceae bacterium]
MLARIYRPAKTAMQSGRAKAQSWVLEFEAGAPMKPDMLMGWTSSVEPNGQVKLYFETREQAIAFARARNIPHLVAEPREPKRVLKAYGDNFAFKRKEPWSH